MPNPIEPALSPEEWARKRIGDSWTYAEIENGDLVATDEERWGTVRIEAAKAIALANAALPDDDPRKITPEKIRFMKDCAHALNACGVDHALHQFARALESYLPPKGT